MNQSPTCPRCGAALPQDAPSGLCPKCLVQAGFESGQPSQPELARTAASPPASGFQPPPLEELAQRFPQLEILELLGKGGMGAVYKARQRGLDRLVAVKILPPEVGADPAFAERFMREARAMAQLSHSNIVGVHDFGQAGGLYYFVMEYVDGVNLRQAIQSGGMTPKEALAIVPQICDALQFAHDEGIVHRDIKPENILIDKRGRVKIADFGLAKLLGQEQADHRLTATHQIMGTLRDMAPEQLEGSHEVDHRADIYSLGVVFYELLTGELPIGRFAPPSKKVQIDVRLDEVVLRALEKEPEQRWQHASELKTSVNQITGSNVSLVEHLPAGRLTDLPPSAPDARLSPCALAGAILVPFALIALLALTVGFFWLSFDRRPIPRNARSRQGVQVPMIMLFILAGLIGIAAPFATTILGFVAIGQIRRSGGKLYGMPLAVFDALFFPLLLLDVVLLALGFGLGVALADLAFQKFGPYPTESVGSLLLFMLLIGSFCAWLDWRIARAVWRNVTGYVPPPKPAAEKLTPPTPQPAAAAVEPQGKNVRVKLGLGFLARSALLATAGWLLAALLWNAREIGLLFAALAVGGLNAYSAECVERSIAAAAGCVRQTRSLRRWVHLVLGALLTAGGVYFLFLGTYQTWDRMNWNTSALTREEFRQEYQGAEHRLLQELDRFKSEAPRAELTQRSWYFTAGGWNITTHALPFIDLFLAPAICGSFMIGALLLWLAYLRLLRDWTGTRNSGRAPDRL